MHLQHLIPTREGSHQGRVLSKGQVQRGHNKEDPRNRVRALLDRGQSQVKDLLVRVPGKVRGHQVRRRNQAKVLLDKDPLGRPPGKVKDQQAKARQGNRDPDQVKGHQVKDHQAKAPQGNKDPDQVKDHQVKDHQVKGPNQVVLLSKKVAHHNKDLGNLDLNSKDPKALEHILGSQQRVLGLLAHRELESLQVDSVPCVRPPS